jgi:hypothetical protein
MRVARVLLAMALARVTTGVYGPANQGIDGEGTGGDALVNERGGGI